MAGSLRLVPGRTDVWELRIYLGRDSEGRVRHRHTRFTGSRRQAERERSSTSDDILMTMRQAEGRS